MGVYQSARYGYGWLSGCDPVRVGVSCIIQVIVDVMVSDRSIKDSDEVVVTLAMQPAGWFDFRCECCAGPDIGVVARRHEASVEGQGRCAWAMNRVFIHAGLGCLHRQTGLAV